MTKRQVILLLLALAFYVPVVYVLFFRPDLARAYTFGEIQLTHLLLVFCPPFLGIVFWLWALYDWGMRRLTKRAKIIWLLIIITTMYFGATAYFLTVGRNEPEGT